MLEWLTTPDPLSLAADPVRAWQETGMLYDRLRQQATRARLRARLTGRAETLLPLLAAEEHGAIAQSRVPQFRTIPLAQIRGTEGRVMDFDAQFRPRHGRLRERWQHVAHAYYLGRPLPAIDVIQVGDIYYVRDGHHRVSVALALGQTDIEANVIVWEIHAAPAGRFNCAPLPCAV